MLVVEGRAYRKVLASVTSLALVWSLTPAMALTQQAAIEEGGVPSDTTGLGDTGDEAGDGGSFAYDADSVVPAEELDLDVGAPEDPSSLGDVLGDSEPGLEAGEQVSDPEGMGPGSDADDEGQATDPEAIERTLAEDEPGAAPDVEVSEGVGSQVELQDESVVLPGVEDSTAEDPQFSREVSFGLSEPAVTTVEEAVSPDEAIPQQVTSSPTLSTAGAAVNDVDLYDASSGAKVGTLRSTYAGKNTVIIVGRSSCGNTENAVWTAAGFASRSEYADISFVVMDLDGEGSSFLDAFGEYASANLKLYSLEGSDIYGDWAWGTHGYGSVTLPFIFLLDSDGVVIGTHTGPVNLRTLVAQTYGLDDPEVKAYDFSVSGTAKQTDARRLLGLVNAARTEKGIANLVWDEDLEQTALQRAAELTLLYSHTRPDGSPCFSAWPSGYTSAAENIAWGYADSSRANDGWTNSPGHYANMTKANVTTFAAACVLDADGSPCWVECFATGPGTGMAHDPVDGTTVHTVSANTSTIGRMDLSFSSDVQGGIRLEKGEAREIGTKVLLNSSARLDPRSLAWSSTDDAVVTVSPTGSLLGTGLGSSTISAVPEGASHLCASTTVRVQANIGSATIASLPAQTYTGSAIEPTPTVTHEGRKLIAGTDYDISYENNVSAGTAKVVITGLGNYVGTKSSTFDVRKAASTIRLANQSRTYTGKALAYSGTVTKTGSAGKVTYAYYSDSACKTAVKAANVKAAGTYYVKATLAADANHNAATSAAVKLTIGKAASSIKLAAQTKTYNGKALAYTGKVTKSGSTGKVTVRYYSDAKCTKEVKAASVKAAKTYYVKGTVAADANHKAATSAAAKLTVTKAANPLAVKAAAKTASLKTLKTKAVAVAPLAVTKAQGKVTYAKVSGSSALTVNKTTGKVTVKKGTKKGTYTAKVKVTAAGSANYKSGSKTVTVKVTVK